MLRIKKFKKLPYFFNFLYEKIVTSIAFIPMLIALVFFLLSGLLFYLEANGLTAWLDNRIPSFLLIKSWDVAQSILTVLVGALISLMVFSFSMVMVLLNNAASNFSPRILPNLIADKFHQIVLGTYLGTITYCLLMTVNMTPNQPDIPLPSVSVLLGIVFGLLCLFLFVFFIHSVSESVQVGKILESLNSDTLEKMKKGTIHLLCDKPIPNDFEKWETYPADHSGYLKSINIESISKICTSENLKIKVLVPESKFVMEGADLFACNKNLDEGLKNKILENFILSISELAKDDHVIGFKQITEIAVKAMSPGINDPGTALSAINYLSILFMKKMKLPEAGAVLLKNKEGKEKPTQLWLSVVKFEELLDFVLAPLRQYSKHDIIVMTKLLDMLKFLKSRSFCNPKNKKTIDREIEILRVDAQQHLSNPADYNKILTSIKNTKNPGLEIL